MHAVAAHGRCRAREVESPDWTAPDVPLRKAVPQLIAVARPPALTGGEIDRAQEPDNIDKRGPTGGIVEVAEAPRTSCQRELLDVRIAMERTIVGLVTSANASQTRAVHARLMKRK